jgi:hypothetical protein
MKYIKSYLSLILTIMIWICLILVLIIPELKLFFNGLQLGLLIGEFFMLLDLLLDREF